MRDPFAFSQHVTVDGGELFVARVGPRPEEADAVVLAVHGITGSHLGWRGPARDLVGAHPEICLLAPDLRGRGRSAGVGPEHGMARHVADLLAVLDDAGIERAVLAGHSMGAYVVARLAAEHPERAGAVVLVDGGLRLPTPPDADTDAMLDATLGPAIARLHMTFGSVEEYLEFWQAHPAFTGRWNEDIEAYARGDLGGEAGAYRSLVVESAIRADGADMLLDDATTNAVERVQAPLRLLTAPRGLLDGDPLIPAALRDAFAAAHPDAVIEEVPDVNHYTITLGDGAGAVAAAIAAAVQDARALA